jgi:hypothetical protein
LIFWKCGVIWLQRAILYSANQRKTDENKYEMNEMHLKHEKPMKTSSKVTKHKGIATILGTTAKLMKTV